MPQRFRTAVQQKVQVKTITLLLGFYFSVLTVMIIFTGFFVYSNFSVPYKSVAASVDSAGEKKDAKDETIKLTPDNKDTNNKISK